MGDHFFAQVQTLRMKGNFEMKSFQLGVLDEVSYEDALKRVLAYCTSEASGWSTYDLPGIVARKAGFFETVTPWSILAANALSARVTQSQVAEFTHGKRIDFAHRLSRIPAGRRLGDMSVQELSAVVELAFFGFKGAWAPTITKLAALYRPDAVPVLDSQLARVCGFNGNAFRAGALRRNRIEQAIGLISDWHKHPDSSRFVDRLRADVHSLVPEIEDISDVRLVDIVVWTTQDDIDSRRGQKKQRWVDMPARDARLRLQSVDAVRVEDLSLRDGLL